MRIARLALFQISVKNVHNGGMQAMAFGVAITTLMGGCFGIVACDRAAEPPPASTTSVPANANATAEPLPESPPREEPLDAEQLARAATLFRANCATCHRANGKGDPHHRKDRIPDLTDAAWQEGRTDAELTASITNGLGSVMPAFGATRTAAEVELLVRYVRALPTLSRSAPTTGGGAFPRERPRRPKHAGEPKPPGEHAGHSGHP
jgi:mono/diheme cytochrome c family protein